MSFFQALVYGLVQGLTEFLPVSSTAHLRIVQALCGWKDPGSAFTAVIQLGTVVAVLLYFRRDLVAVTLGWLHGLTDRSARGIDYRMGWYLILATIPVGVLGLIFKDQITTSARNLWVISTALIVMALALGVAERIGTQTRAEEDVNVRDAGAVGLAQALALIPGVSRSGSTITAGLLRGLDRPAAARFSFLLSVPAVVLSGLFEARDIGGAGAPGLGVTLVATVVSFVVGLGSIAWLLRYISKHSTLVFIYYRIAMGALLMILLGTGVLSSTK